MINEISAILIQYMCKVGRVGPVDSANSRHPFFLTSRVEDI